MNDEELDPLEDDAVICADHWRLDCVDCFHIDIDNDPTCPHCDPKLCRCLYDDETGLDLSDLIDNPPFDSPEVGG